MDMTAANLHASTQNHLAQGSELNLSHISQALHATLDPAVSNLVRQQALQHLEAVKSQPDAPAAGFALANDRGQPDAVRYYGLQLLEFAIRFRWHEYNGAQTTQLREWVTGLAGGLRQTDARFVRNKIGQLWVEVAKRCWGGSVGDDEDEEDELDFREEPEAYANGTTTDGAAPSGIWWEMDAQLLALWEKDEGSASKLLVLYVLETLSEEIINGEDAVAGLRMEVLGHALNEVMVPAGLYREHARTRGARPSVRAGSEGWLHRMCAFFALCVEQARAVGPSDAVARARECAAQALHALRPTVGWISLKAADEVGCVECLFRAFHTNAYGLQTAAVEVLYALLGRPYNLHWQGTWMRLYRQALQPERIALIRRTFEDTQAGPGEDDETYTLQKKMAELLAVLADAVAAHPELADDALTLGLPTFFELLRSVLQSRSLTVSIPILHAWTKQMGVPTVQIVDLVLAALPTLLQTCSERLLRYELLPEDTADEIVQFLNDDFDTAPERHAFLGNYRRYCNHIIQSITRSRPIEALSHVMGQMLELLQHGPYSVAHGFASATYSRNAIPVLRFDAQYTVVSSALKGYSAWVNDVSQLPLDDPLHVKAEKDQQEAATSLQQWCYHIITLRVDDPCVADQVVQTLVAVLRTLKVPPAGFVLDVVHHLLSMRLYDEPAHTTFSDAVKSFEAMRIIEIQKLALSFPNYLLDVYNQLESRMEELCQQHSDDQRLVWGYRAFLFMIIHRADRIEPDMRMDRLRTMLKPTYEAWTNPSLAASVHDLQSFCETIGLGNIHEFYRTHGFDRIQDWTAQQLDTDGQARQNEVRERSDRLPVRMTKSMLAASTERLKSGTQEHETACALWGDLIPAILPNLLQMLRHAQAFHNMDNWAALPPELQAVVRRTLQDRFWQSGISSESKDEFYARISGSKTSYEGFASTVRGTTRNVREQGYHILYLLTKFDEQFYGLADLAEPLATALFADAASLGANHLHPIINLTTGLVQRCPPHHRARFLPPIVRRLFLTLDAKISAEWEALGQITEHQEDDELSDEMRTESVLRQLTYSMVSFVPFLLEHDRHPSSGSHHSSAAINGNGHAPPRPTLSDLVLSDPTILEPLILFCTHALRMRDTRCCTTICRVFRTIIPVFGAPPASTSTPNSANYTTNNTVHPSSSSPSHPAPIVSDEAAAQVREFVSTAVLQACITSLHEPYFADMQKDLAALIAQILALYAPRTPTPRAVLLSLPQLSPSRVDHALAKLTRGSSSSSSGATGAGGTGSGHRSGGSSERQQRSIVLELLASLRGVSIHEAGKIERANTGMGTSGNTTGGSSGGGKGGGRGGHLSNPDPAATAKKARVSARYMEVEPAPRIVDGDEVGLDGVAGLFGEG